MKNVVKRDERIEPFDNEKIINAIKKANLEVDDNERLNDRQIDYIISIINDMGEQDTVENIQDAVEKGIIGFNKYELAKKYIIYRYKRDLVRKQNTTDESILKLVNYENEYVMEENSNKDAYVASTQRDLIAGEVSKDLTKRILLPEKIVKAHNEGILHFHDMDYFLQKIHNCCLINIGDMLDNGTCINGKKVDTPKSFQVACTVMTQIIAAVACGQYGGQSVSIKHLGKYLKISEKKFRKKIIDANPDLTNDQIENELNSRLNDELKSGVQTIQYQLNTIMTTNGQTPFVTLFLDIDPGSKYADENAKIVYEIINQRYKGLKNEQGVYVTPTFPKLIYPLYEENNLSGGKFDYITKLAAKCTAKRMYPDYISSKKMRENYEGEVFSCMGCVDGDEVITYKINDKLYVEGFKRAWNRLSSLFEVVEQSKGSCNYYIDLHNVKIYDKNKGFVNTKRIIRNKSNNWLKVTMKNGHSIECTSDHPFHTTNRGRIYAKDLIAGVDIVEFNNNQYSEEFIDMDLYVAWCLGFFLCNDRRNLDSDIKIPMKDDIFCKYFMCEKEKVNDNLIDMFGGTQENNSHIPNCIFASSKEAKIFFISGMIDANGYVYKNGKIRIKSSNKELSIQQLLLIQSLGFNANLHEKTRPLKNDDEIIYTVEFNVTNDIINSSIINKYKYANVNIITDNNDTASSITLIESIDKLNKEDFSYDVTTDSDYFDVSGMYSHNCRSFLSPWKDENGKYKWEGRFNMGVVSINLPQIGIIANGDEDKFWKLLDERLLLCKEALMCRYKSLKETPSDISPIHWQYGALARLEKGETIDKLLENGYSTISLGYIGIYETVYAMKHVSHTTKIGHDFSIKIMNALKKATEDWKKETGLGFGLYGSPAESLCYRFAKIDKEKFGSIKNITDKGYYTNSYHVDVREKIDVFSKFSFESEYQSISTGGCISYVEIPNMLHNISAIEDIIKFIYDNIQYAEFNTKSDYCMKCGYDGEIIINEDGEWECPQCHNKDHKLMSVTRRTCGYIGSNFWNKGKTKEISSRVLHL